MLVFPYKNILLISHDAGFGASWTSLQVMGNSSLKKSISPMPRCNERKNFSMLYKKSSTRSYRLRKICSKALKFGKTLLVWMWNF